MLGSLVALLMPVEVEPTPLWQPSPRLPGPQKHHAAPRICAAVTWALKKALIGIKGGGFSPFSPEKKTDPDYSASKVVGYFDSSHSWMSRKYWKDFHILGTQRGCFSSGGDVFSLQLPWLDLSISASSLGSFPLGLGQNVGTHRCWCIKSLKKHMRIRGIHLNTIDFLMKFANIHLGIQNCWGPNRCQHQVLIQVLVAISRWCLPWVVGWWRSHMDISMEGEIGWWIQISQVISVFFILWCVCKMLLIQSESVLWVLHSLLVCVFVVPFDTLRDESCLLCPWWAESGGWRSMGLIFAAPFLLKWKGS